MLTSKSLCYDNIDKILKSVDLNSAHLASVKQIHSNNIIFTNKKENPAQADGIITSINSNLVLSIITADCMPIFIYDNYAGYYGLIHAGWKGVVSKIHQAAISKFSRLGSKLENISIFVGPSIKDCCFEVQSDIVNNFKKEYLIKKENKTYINLLRNVLDDFIIAGILKKNISYDKRCTYDDDMCCSYRRDGRKSGRMFSLITHKK